MEKIVIRAKAPGIIASYIFNIIDILSVVKYKF